MGKRIAHTPGVKWHRGADGIARRCSASVRSCPYGEHFETETDAASNRQRQANGLAITERVRFDTQLGQVPDSSKGEEGISLRQSAEKAMETFARTGHRPQSPLGKADIWLPGGQRVSLLRETYDRPNSLDSIGVRYIVRYFPTADSYEENSIELNNRVEYEILVKQIDEYFAEASDQAAMRGEDSSQLVPFYKQTIQTIAEVETMSRGADSAYRKFGIDLFNHSRPGELTIDIDYDNSTVHSYDISDALKGHAMSDKFLNDIALHVKGEIPGTDGAKWSLDRLPEGDWLVGANSSVGVVSQNVSTPEEARKVLNTIFKGHKAPQEYYQSQLNYAQQVMQEVEPAINSYRATVEGKIEERRRMDLSAAANPPAGRPMLAEEGGKKRRGFGERIGGLFT